MVHSRQNMQNSIALRLLWEAPDGSANQNVYPLIPLTHPPDLAHRHTQLCLMAIVRAEVAVFKWDHGWLRYTDPKWQPASMRCIPAKTRLPDDIFRGAGTRPVPVAVQLPKSPWWPPLAEYIIVFSLSVAVHLVRLAIQCPLGFLLCYRGLSLSFPPLHMVMRARFEPHRR